jgi:hypothetical protein
MKYLCPPGATLDAFGPGEQQGSIVVFLAQMGDQVLAHHPAQRVLQLHRLDKQVMLGIKLRRAHCYAAELVLAAPFSEINSSASFMPGTSSLKLPLPSSSTMLFNLDIAILEFDGLAP